MYVFRGYFFFAVEYIQRMIEKMWGGYIYSGRKQYWSRKIAPKSTRIGLFNNMNWSRHNNIICKDERDVCIMPRYARDSRKQSSFSIVKGLVSESADSELLTRWADNRITTWVHLRFYSYSKVGQSQCRMSEGETHDTTGCSLGLRF